MPYSTDNLEPAAVKEVRCDMQVRERCFTGYEYCYSSRQEKCEVKTLATFELIKPTADLRLEFMTMAKEYQCLHDDRYHDAIEDFNAYIRSLEDWSFGRNLPDGFVPSDTFWLANDGRRILGCSRLRYRLTPWLEQEGGHIGYDIRPLERQKGYGAVILAMTLEKAKEAGLERALVTCDKHNIASAKIIEKNGGRLENEVLSSRNGKMVLRYWITL